VKIYPFATQAYDVRLYTRFDEVLALDPTPAVIAVDIPIGLPETIRPGGRACDRQARQLLGRRASSVFSPPSRSILETVQYDHVRVHGVSRQTFGIMPKIREVDQLMTPALQQIVHEAHPELAFMSLTGHPMRHNKKTPAGREERLKALTRAAPFRCIRDGLESILALFNRTQVAPDDLFDACVLARTAWRIANSQATRIPAKPMVDACGLRMEIWF
jgi:predicted RNase H-like nuclease